MLAILLKLSEKPFYDFDQIEMHSTSIPKKNFKHVCHYVIWFAMNCKKFKPKLI